MDANSGFHYFTDKKADENESNIIHEKTIKQGETAEFYLGRAFGNIDAGETTFMKTESKYPVYYGKELYSKNPKSTDTDENGKIGNKDVQLLFKYISKIDINYDFDIEKFDVNDDGIVNNKDVIMLFNLSSKS